MFTVILTFVPSILILSYFILNDKFKEPIGSIILIFFLGFLICLPAGILNGLSDDFFFKKLNYSEDLTVSFLGPAMDGLVYGVTVSLGFATYENYTYVYEWAVTIAKDENFSAEAFSYLVALGRSYSAIPLHGFNGAVMGYYFGMYAFTGNKNYLALSLALPYLFHGFYNYLSFPNSMVIVVILVIFSIYLHNDLKKKQKLKQKEKEQIKI